MDEHALFDLDGTTDLPPGKIASVVTYLEMERPATVPSPDGRITLARLGCDDALRYQRIYRRIGETWFWFARLGLATQDIAAVLEQPSLHAYAALVDGQDAGLLEIDFAIEGEAELVYFGLTEGFIGRGLGRQLMNHAQALAWAAPIGRFWLHICTLDHPGAVAFYRRSGFRPFKLGIEIVDDPRLTGAMPRSAFPDVPLREP